MKRLLIFAIFIYGIIFFEGCEDKDPKYDKDAIRTEKDGKVSYNFSVIKTSGNFSLIPTDYSGGYSESPVALGLEQQHNMDIMLSEFENTRNVKIKQTTYFRAANNSGTPKVYISVITEPVDTTYQALHSENARLLAATNELTSQVKTLDLRVKRMSNRLRFAKKLMAHR